MSAENKTRLEVQAILKSTIAEGLAVFGVDASRFTIMEANQTPITSRGYAILFKMVSGRRTGIQAPKYRVVHDDDGNVTGAFFDHSFIDEQEWLISVLKPRMPNPTPATLLAEDVAQTLIAWFNGPGCVRIRQKGVSSLYIREKPVEVYKNDSALYDKSASFTLKLLVPKKLSVEAPSATLEWGGLVPV